jgi:hypothetical protein
MKNIPKKLFPEENFGRKNQVEVKIFPFDKVFSGSRSEVDIDRLVRGNVSPETQFQSDARV